MRKYRGRTNEETQVLEILYKDRFNLSDETKALRIDQTPLSFRLQSRIIRNLKIETVGQLLNFADRDLLRMWGIARTSVRFLNHYLSQMNIPNKCKITNGKFAWRIEVIGKLNYTLNVVYQDDAEFIAKTLTLLGYEIEWIHEEQDI